MVFNPRAGRENKGEEVRAALARHFALPGRAPEIYETSGAEDVAAICREARGRGASLVIAAGGDGTLIGVANGLVGSPVPIGILPLGTANFLARALHIPMGIEDAASLLVHDHAMIEVDALEMRERYFFTNVSVGISPGIVDGTKSADKKRFGRLAYFIAMAKGPNIFKSRRYLLKLDDRSLSIRAVEVVVSNSTLLEKPSFVFGPRESLYDGKLEVYVFSPHTVSDYAILARDLFLRSGRPAAKLSHWAVERCARIDSLRSSLLVQADGELIGRTPIEIHLVPKAIHVIVPK